MLGVRPFVSRASLEAKLADDGLAARTIVNHLNPAYTDRLIGALINADAIQKTEEGWAIIDETWASALTLAKAG
jgi:hypothetical protein